MKYNKDLFLFRLIYGKTLKGQTLCFVWSLHVTSWKKGLFLFCNVGLLGCCDHYNQQCGWGGVGGVGHGRRREVYRIIVLLTNLPEINEIVFLSSCMYLLEGCK